MFEPVIAAKLRPCDLSKLLGVSRVTCSLWLNGRSNPHRLLAGRVKRLLDIVGLCVQNGTLPVSRDVHRRERAHHIQTVLAAQGWKFESLD